MFGVTRAIVGCSTWVTYQSTLPFTALLWRERIGFEPFLLLAGDWGKHERSRVTLRAIDALGIERVMLPPIEGYEDATLSQNCRQLAAALPFPDGAWLMTSDADLWPIKREFYQQHLGRHHMSVTSYYANGDHYQSYPTCHIAATARAWRQMYGIKATDGDVSGRVKAHLDEWKLKSPMYAAQPNKPFAVWCSDQWMMTEKIKASGLSVHHIERRGHPPVDRIDREGDPQNWAAEDPTVFVDAHIHKLPLDEKRWNDVLRLGSKLLPKHAAWFADYRERYQKAFQGEAANAVK